MNLEIINTVITAAIPLLIFYFGYRLEREQKKISEEIKKRDTFFNARFNYKKQSLEELLGPLLMQLKRSEIIFYKYEGNDAYKEVILKQCNETTRDLILNKSYHIPPDLMDEAAKLLSHYDGWLQYYHQVREVENDKETPFVYTFDFPPNVEKRFREKYDEYRAQLNIDDGIKKPA